MSTNIFKIIKSIFIKEKTFPCIIWDGKKMSYLNLTKTQIKEIEEDPNRGDWSVTIDEDKIKF